MTSFSRTFSARHPVLSLLSLLVALSIHSSTQAQDVPDPNPRPNSDGTFTWWVGNDMQFPVIQEVLDAAFPGDEIVIMEGLYVEDLVLSNDDLTVRPACTLDGQSPVWEDVVLWNPTEGFEDDPWSIKVDDSHGCYIGRPRQFFQLANGYQALSTVEPGEWAPVSSAADVATITSNTNGVAMTFWSRDIGSVAIYARGGTPTFHSCLIQSQSGFGCGLLAAGDGCAVTLVDCEFTDFFGDSGVIDGIDMEPITIHAGPSEIVNPRFRNCTVRSCISGARGVVNQTGGRTSWIDCRFLDNDTPVSDGMIFIDDGPANFTNCVFSDNLSRMGTIHVSAGPVLLANRSVEFDRCDFIGNQTIDGQYGGVVFATGVEGSPPPIEFSGCGIDGNNGHVGFNFFDIRTPFFPYYRLGEDLRDMAVNQAGEGSDLNGDGIVDGADLVELLSDWTL